MCVRAGCPQPSRQRENKTRPSRTYVRIPVVFRPFHVPFPRTVRVVCGTNDVTLNDDDPPTETPAAGIAERTRRRRPRPDMNRSVRFSPYPGGGGGLTAVLRGVDAIGSGRRSDGRHTGSGPRVGDGAGGYSTAADSAAA